MLRMVDRIDAYVPDGGSKGLGLVVGRIAVDPAFWFFQAHFYQDPVWPGSLGLESFLQLLKYAAWKRWGDPGPAGWQTVGLGPTAHVGLPRAGAADRPRGDGRAGSHRGGRRQPPAHGRRVPDRGRPGHLPDDGLYTRVTSRAPGFAAGLDLA